MFRFLKNHYEHREGKKIYKYFFIKNIKWTEKEIEF